MENKTPNAQPSGSGNKPGKPGKALNFYWVYAIVAVFLLAMVMLGESSGQKRLHWPEFKEMAEAGQIAKVNSNGRTASVFFTKEVRDSLIGDQSEPQL